MQNDTTLHTMTLTSINSCTIGIEMHLCGVRRLDAIVEVAETVQKPFEVPSIFNSSLTACSSSIPFSPRPPKCSNSLFYPPSFHYLDIVMLRLGKAGLIQAISLSPDWLHPLITFALAMDILLQ